jgi:EAL domain-containing protein (putative c-di-GMP-specific phosphodiesterase class I)
VDELGGASDDSAPARAIIDLGCDLGQGLQLAEPMTPQALEEILSDHPRSAVDRGPGL